MCAFNRGLHPRAHAEADVLSAEIIRAASRDGAVRLRINDALNAWAPLNCEHAVHAGSGSVQPAMRRDAHNVERDALGIALHGYYFFDGLRFCMAAPPNGGRQAARGVKAARNDLAVHDRNASVLHANRRFVGLFRGKLNEARISARHE